MSDQTQTSEQIDAAAAAASDAAPTPSTAGASEIVGDGSADATDSTAAASAEPTTPAAGDVTLAPEGAEISAFSPPAPSTLAVTDEASTLTDEAFAEASAGSEPAIEESQDEPCSPARRYEDLTPLEREQAQTSFGPAVTQDGGA
jgi:hypothetical protein